MNKIVLECKPDEAFVKTLGFSRRNIIHQPNKGAVFNYLKKNPGAIGLVDEDPGSANPNFFFAISREQQTKVRNQVLRSFKRRNKINCHKSKIRRMGD